MSEQIEDLGGKFDRRFSDLETEVKFLGTEVKALGTEVKSLGNRVSSLEVEVKSTGDAVEKLETQMRRNTENYINLEVVVGDMQGEFISLNDLILDVKNTVIPASPSPQFAHTRNSSGVLTPVSGLGVTPASVDDSPTEPGPSTGSSSRGRLMVGRIIGAFVSSSNLKKKAR